MSKFVHETHLAARRPAVVMPLTRNDQEWACEHSRWNLQQWSCVLFSDEIRYNEDSSDAYRRVWRAKGERVNA